MNIRGKILIAASSLLVGVGLFAAVKFAPKVAPETPAVFPESKTVGSQGAYDENALFGGTVGGGGEALQLKGKTSIQLKGNNPDIFAGCYVGDATTSLIVDTAAPFQPEAVLVTARFSAGNVMSFVRTSTMTGNSVSIGNSSTTEAAITSIRPHGFSVRSTLNQANTWCYMLLNDADSSLLHVGTYIGDGNDNRNITGIPFTPTFVLILDETTATSTPFKTSHHVGEATSQTQALADIPTDAIQTLSAGAFQIGTSNRVNRAGDVYHYIALQSKPGTFAEGTYTGDGVNGRTITTGIDNAFVMVGRSSGQNRPFKMKEHVTGRACFFQNGIACGTGIISTFVYNGFKVSALIQVNGSGGTYYWAAFGTNPTALQLK